MFHLIAVAFALNITESTTEKHNRELLPYLVVLAESDEFSKLKTTFAEKCPVDAKKCKLASCTVPQIKYQGQDGYIDLLAVKESFSSGSKNGADVWARLYSLVGEDEEMKKILSGLHFSVTTHLSAFHTQILGRYYSNPLLFRKKYRREYRENFMYLYGVVRAAIAALPTNKGEISEAARNLGVRLRKTIARETRQRNEGLLYQGAGKGRRPLLDRREVVDVEAVQDGSVLDSTSTSELQGTQPRISKDAIGVVNEMSKYIACLECQKCRLWGTVQARGIKGSIKALNGIPLFRNDVLYMVNLFKQLSITMVESKRLMEIKLPSRYLLLICHKQLGIVLLTMLSLTVGYLRIQRKRKIKTE